MSGVTFKLYLKCAKCAMRIGETYQREEKEEEKRGRGENDHN